MLHVRYVVSAMIGLLGFVTPTAYAGHSVGGGGTGVVCYDNNHTIRSIEIYDYFYARKLGRQIDLGPSQEDYKAQAQVALNRLAAFSPLRAQKYAEQIQAFASPQEALFLEDTSLFHIPDLGQPVLDPGPGCELVQIVYQQEPRFGRDKRYLINAFYWKQLNQTQKAGLVLHEVIYREAMSYGQSDSSGAREFNMTFSETTPTALTYQDFFTLLRGIPFIETDLLGSQTVLGTCHKNTESGRPACQGPDDVESWVEAEFYPSGNLQKVTYLTSPDPLKNSRYTLLLASNKTKFKDVSFYDTRSPVLQEINLEWSGFNGFTVFLPNSNTIYQGPYSRASFHPNGHLQMAQSAYGAFLPNQQKVNGQVWFNDNGKLTKVHLEKPYGHFDGLKYHNYPLIIAGEGDIFFHNEDWQTSIPLSFVLGKYLATTTITASQESLTNDLFFRADGSLERANGDRVKIISRIPGICLPARGGLTPIVNGPVSFHHDGTLASGSLYLDSGGNICLEKSDGTRVEWRQERYLGKIFTFDTQGFWTGEALPRE